MNKNVTVSRANTRDREMLKQLWMSVFGDPEPLVDAFFMHFPPEESAWVIRDGETILSAAYLITGNRLITTHESREAAYVYAVATPSSQRGLGYGGMLMRHFCALQEQLDFVLYTRPAEPSLFSWYAKHMHTADSGFCSQVTICAQGAPCDAEIRSLTAEEYAAARSEALRGESHIELCVPFLKLQETYLQAEGGGFCRIGNACICAYERDEGRIRIKEIFESEDTASEIRSLLHMLGQERAVVSVQAHDGEPCVAYRFGADLRNVNWGLLLD